MPTSCLFGCDSSRMPRVSFSDTVATFTNMAETFMEQFRLWKKLKIRIHVRESSWISFVGFCKPSARIVWSERFHNVQQHGAERRIAANKKSNTHHWSFSYRYVIFSLVMSYIAVEKPKIHIVLNRTKLTYDCVSTSVVVGCLFGITIGALLLEFYVKLPTWILIYNRLKIRFAAVADSFLIFLN